jgi:hypothetical protein
MNSKIATVAIVALALSPAVALAQEAAPQQKPGETMEMKHADAPSSPERA